MAMAMPHSFLHGSQLLKARSTCSKGVQPRSCRIVAKFALPELPYDLDALEPHMSRQTLEFHWGKHQRAYIDNLNKQIENTELDGYLLRDIILASYNRGSPLPAFNNASQAWNHDFFFNSMRPDGGKAPTGEIAELIDKDFGSYDEFAQQFKLAATSQFGAGWAWLSLKNAKLVVDKTPNAVSPIIWDQIPLLVIDVWEHAYYLDFQNRRPDYVTTFLEHLVDWDTVNARLDRARAFMNWGEPEIPPFLRSEAAEKAAEKAAAARAAAEEEEQKRTAETRGHEGAT